VAILSFMLILGLAGLGGSVWAAFSAKTTNSGNTVTAAADWVAPTASSSVIGKTQGGTPGFIHQGGSYNAYANVADTGNPASGTASVKGNVSSVSTGLTATALISGSYSIGATSYNYRTANLSANATLTAGTFSYSLTSTDNAGNIGTQSGFTVIVDNTAPTASDIQTTNKSGNIAARPEIGDTIVFTYSEPIDPNSVLAGWTGAPTNVVVRINDKAGQGSNDQAAVYNAANSLQLPLGTVDLGNDYVTANADFGVTGTASSMAISGNAITVTLGTASAGPRTATSNGAMVWAPSALATDRAGNAESTTTRTETGTADKEF
jgi:hypothetical protein